MMIMMIMTIMMMMMIITIIIINIDYLVYIMIIYETWLNLCLSEEKSTAGPHVLSPTSETFVWSAAGASHRDTWRPDLEDAEFSDFDLFWNEISMYTDVQSIEFSMKWFEMSM